MEKVAFEPVVGLVSGFFFLLLFTHFPSPIFPLLLRLLSLLGLLFRSLRLLLHSLFLFLLGLLLLPDLVLPGKIS